MTSNNDDSDTNELIKSHVGGLFDKSYVKSICLEEGKYEFVIFDRDGICCGAYGDGNYNVTAANGALIVEGGDFEESESTSFSIPFVP